MSIFNLEGDQKGITISIIGKRYSGKSWLLVNRILLSEELLMGKFDELILIHPNYQYDIKYHKLDIKQIFTEFNQDLVEMIGEYAQKKYEKNNDYRLCLICDDCIGASDFGKNKKTPLDNLFYNSRHYGLSLIVVSQRIYGLPKSIRTQMDYVILFNTRNGNEYRDIYDSYGSEDKNEWKQLWKYSFKKRNEEERPFILIDTNRGIYYRNFNKLDF